MMRKVQMEMTKKMMRMKVRHNSLCFDLSLLSLLRGMLISRLFDCTEENADEEEKAAPVK